MDKNISFTLKVWRQKGPKAKGAFETYQMKAVSYTHLTLPTICSV